MPSASLLYFFRFEKFHLRGALPIAAQENVRLGRPVIWHIADNRRVFDGSTYVFWSMTGKAIGRYRINGNVVEPGSGQVVMRFEADEKWVYAGGRLIARGLASGSFEAVLTDRVGSVRVQGTASMSYFPFGQERTSSGAGNRFGTYYRDSGGLDYANQRYYASQFGRFMTADPSDSADRSDPSTWNLYTYVSGDPINYNDPEGLVKCGDLLLAGSGASLRDVYNGATETSLFAQLVWAEAAAPTNATFATETYFREREAIAVSVINRHRILHRQISIAGVPNVATLGWGPQNASFTQIIGWSSQYDVMTGGPNNPHLRSNIQSRLNGVLEEEGTAIQFEFGGRQVSMSVNCANVWQSSVVSFEALSGRVRDPFVSRGITTSFNSSRSIVVGSLEQRFGDFGTANNFFGITPPPAPAAGPRTSDGGGGRRRQ